MKKMKNVFITGVILAAALLITACGTAGSKTPGEATTSVDCVEADDPESVKLYKDVLEDEAVRKEYPYYRFQDINLDGEDELFLSTTDNPIIGKHDKACLMVYADGDLKTLQEIGGLGKEYRIFNQIDATLSYVSKAAGEEHIILYRLEDGELKVICTADFYDPHCYTKKDNDKKIYLIDDEEVSEEEGESFLEQYGNEAGAMTYKAIDDSFPID